MLTEWVRTVENSVSNSVADDGLEEGLENATALLVDEAGDALDTATAGQAADGRLGDALDVVAQGLAVTLGAALAESLASLAASRHCLGVSDENVDEGAGAFLEFWANSPNSSMVEHSYFRVGGLSLGVSLIVLL